MKTDIDQEMDQGKVKDLFQAFQRQREHAPYERQQAIMDKLHPTTIVPLVNGETEDEQAVIDQYRTYMRVREGNKEEVIAWVTAYAKSKTDEGATMQSPVANEAAPKSLRPYQLQWPDHMLGRVREWIGKLFEDGGGYWKLALSVLAMVGIALWFSQIVVQSVDDSQSIAWNYSLPAGVTRNAQGIVNKLQPALPSTLGFTQHNGTLSAGFELGQSMAYIELVLAAQSEKHLLGRVRRADSLANHLGLPLLSAQVDLQEDAASLKGIAQRWFEDKEELSLFYQLGYWMETTQFALQLTDLAEDLAPIAEQLSLLKEYRPQWDKRLVDYPLQLRQFDKLAELDVASLETSYGRQMFTRQLERTIAVFKNL